MEVPEEDLVTNMPHLPIIMHPLATFPMPVRLDSRRARVANLLRHDTCLHQNGGAAFMFVVPPEPAIFVSISELKHLEWGRRSVNTTAARHLDL